MLIILWASWTYPKLLIVPRLKSNIYNWRKHLSTNLINFLQVHLLEWFFRNIFKNKQIPLYLFFFQKIRTYNCRTLWVYNKIPQSFCKGYFNSNIILRIIRLNKFIKLTKISFALLLQFIQNLSQFHVLCPDLFVLLKLFEFKLFIHKLHLHLFASSLAPLTKQSDWIDVNLC